MRSFSYSPGAGFSEVFLLHSCTPDDTSVEIVLVRSFPYTPDASFSEEFLLHS